jgi:uncharacterized protein (DUF169 family)
MPTAIPTDRAGTLHLATFDPDVVVCYGNSAQITRFVQGALYKVGGYIESRFAGRGACGGEITVPYSRTSATSSFPARRAGLCPHRRRRIAFAMPARD